MALATGKIGLEDLALGYGQETQDLGNDRTRVITKINAGNLPFGENTTFEQAIVDFAEVLRSAEVLNITENKQAILNLNTELRKLVSLSNELDGLTALADRSDILDALTDNLATIANLHNSIVKTEQAVADAKYREYRILKAEEDVSKRLAYVSNLCNQDILPMKSQLDMLVGLLDNKIATIRAELVEGNEMASKLASYEWVLNVVRACKVPKWYIDDARRQIVLTMPQPICANNVEVDATIVRDSVNAYLATLPDLGGSGIDEAVTVDDLEPIEWYDLLGATTSGQVKIRYDSDDHGIVLSRFANDGMEVDDTSLFIIKIYDTNGTFVSRYDYNAVYESDRELISVYNTEEHPLGYMLLSYKKDSNQADFDFTDVVVIYDTNDNKWKEQGS